MTKTRIDKEQLIELNSRDLTLEPDKYQKILLMALEIGAKDILVLETSIENADYALIHIISHKIKGMFGNLRLNDVGACAERIDELAKNFAQVKQIRAVYIELKKIFNEINELFL